jgi:hypothetical protein
MTYKLFIDDERLPVGDGWKIARSSVEAIFLVKLYGMPQEISFDHDLGEDDTSMFFIHWMINRLLDGRDYLPDNFKFSVHSQNPVGKDNINQLMNNFLKYNETPNT